MRYTGRRDTIYSTHARAAAQVAMKTATMRAAVGAGMAQGAFQGAVGNLEAVRGAGAMIGGRAAALRHRAPVPRRIHLEFRHLCSWVTSGAEPQVCGRILAPVFWARLYSWGSARGRLSRGYSAILFPNSVLYKERLQR